MFLAGEEFAEIHDLQYSDDSLKMSDPVDWDRRSVPGHSTLQDAVASLIKLRTSTEALQRNEIDFFYFHPDTDQNEGARVFAYCRTAGRPLGSAGQVIVVANAGAQTYSSFDFPYWPWGHLPEVAGPLAGTAAQFPFEPRMTVSLGPFQARVFTS
jgi:1,4-alpha-glucan branching enzyme